MFEKHLSYSCQLTNVESKRVEEMRQMVLAAEMYHLCKDAYLKFSDFSDTENMFSITESSFKDMTQKNNINWISLSEVIF